MSRYIPDNLRKIVAHRARFRCEYCRLLAEDVFFAFHMTISLALNMAAKQSPKISLILVKFVI